MFPSHFQGLWLRIALPFLCFVVAGSLALVFWLQVTAQRESRSVFAALAKTNADFIRSEHVPTTERTADALSRVLGVEVFLWPLRGWESQFLAFMTRPDVGAGPSKAVSAAHLFPGHVQAHGRYEAVAVRVSEDVELMMLRETEPGAAQLFESRTLGVLGAFWALSLGLAWALARGVVLPLRLLARRLPHIGNDADATLPGAERADEIGQLARAYLGTCAQLAEERARREQAERLAILGRMATGLAHEIHNPLSAIRMHAQLLESTPACELASAANVSLPILIEETAQIEGLVNQWMFLARPAPPQTAWADLGLLVGAVVRAHSATAKHSGVEIDVSLPSGSGLGVRVDARRVAQALGNVVLNAIQAMPEGGLLSITGQQRPGLVCLVFRDTGRGFSGTALARHAELFYSEKEGGMGIGLNVSTEILKAHGGQLLVANASDRPSGALVVFELPAFTS